MGQQSDKNQIWFFCPNRRLKKKKRHMPFQNAHIAYDQAILCVWGVGGGSRLLIQFKTTEQNILGTVQGASD